MFWGEKGVGIYRDRRSGGKLGEFEVGFGVQLP
jgi:hypothetical protein